MIDVALRLVGTVGSVVSGGGVVVLETVTVIAKEVRVLPAASRATAVIVCVPFVASVVFQVPEYGAVVSSLPRLMPSTLNWTPTTPTLSWALATRVILPETVEPVRGAVMLTVGNVVSGAAPKAAVIVVPELTVQVVAVVQPLTPVQPAKVLPPVGVAVSTTEVPVLKVAVHVPVEQLIPLGLEVIVPVPEPALVAEIVYVVA